MPTEAQIKANQQNAQKSSGPRTPAGKAVSARNSLKHGLTGAALVQPEGPETELLQIKVQQWTRDLRPQTDTETWLVTEAAIAAARLDRCVRYETATIEHRLRHLPATREEQKIEELEQLLEQLPRYPERTQQKLLKTAHGTRYLLHRWQALRSLLAAPTVGYWRRSHLSELPQLLGRPLWAHIEDSDLLEIGCYALASQPDKVFEPKLAQELRKTPIESPEHLAAIRKQLPTREEAQKALLQFVDANINELEAHLEPLETIEALDDAQAPDLALFDDSPQSARLHRYEAALHRQLNQALLRLERLRATHPAPAPPRNYELHTPQPQNPPPPKPTPAAVTHSHIKNSVDSKLKHLPRQNEANPPLYELAPPPASFLNITAGRPQDTRHNRKNKHNR